MTVVSPDIRLPGEKVQDENRAADDPKAHSCLEKLCSPRATLVTTNRKQMIVIASSVQRP